MNLTININPKKLTLQLIISVIVLAVLSVVVQVSKYVFKYRSDWTKLFILDQEMNIPTWYSAMLLVACAVLLKIIATGKKLEDDKFYLQWKWLSLIFWFLAIDEILSIHEALIIPQLAKALHLPGFLRPVWVIPGSLVIGFFFYKYWPFTLSLPKQSRRHFILAGLLYVGGSLVMEMVGGQYAYFYGRNNLGYALITNVEEVMEMLGVIFFIWALLFYLGKWQNYLQIHLNLNLSGNKNQNI